MTDILVEKKNVIMDATMLSSLMSCPRFHDFRHNHCFASLRGKSNSLETGALLHKVLEVFYKHLINGFDRKTALGQALTAGQLYINGCPHCSDESVDTPACGHEAGEYPGMQNTPEHSEGYKTGWRFVLDTCEKYVDFYKNDSWIPLAAEHVKREILYEDDEIRVLWKAKFDLILDTNQIGIVSMDHKSFKQRRDKTTLSNQFSGQCLLLKSRNVIVNKIGFQSSLKIEERLSREIVSYSADRLLEWQSEILPYYAYKLLQYAESEHWPPNYTHCDNVYGSCAFKSVCESDTTMRNEVLRNEFRKIRKWDVMNRDED